MIRVQRRHGVLLFAGFVLIVWQCYYINWSPTIQHLLPNNSNASLSDVVATPKSPENYDLMDMYERERVDLGDEAPYKRILFWNEAYGTKNYGVGLGKDALRRAGCPVWQCETSDVRKGILNYDAVLFHLRSWTRSDLPHTNAMAGFFNWTMTYRWDSDIVNSYGWFAPKSNSTVPLHPTDLSPYLINDDVNYAAGKTSMAAWFVSNCESLSGRQEFVKHLQRYIDVDIYGECGTKVCSRKHEDDCRDMAAKKYKFYLSLENSLCADYITEKFYGMMHYNIIPIVIDVHGHHSKSAPSHSFINAAQFPDVKQLADYLILLDKNDTLYNEYFWWKPHFTVRNNASDFNVGMCHLCAALHNESLPAKVYYDMTEWWEKQSSCKTVRYE